MYELDTNDPAMASGVFNPEDFFVFLYEKQAGLFGFPSRFSLPAHFVQIVCTCLSSLQSRRHEANRPCVISRR